MLANSFDLFLGNTGLMGKAKVTDQEKKLIDKCLTNHTTGLMGKTKVTDQKNKLIDKCRTDHTTGLMSKIKVTDLEKKLIDDMAVGIDPKGCIFQMLADSFDLFLGNTGLMGKTEVTDQEKNLIVACCKLMAEEHGELSKNCAEAHHQYDRAMLARPPMEGMVFERTMSGFNLRESKEPKVQVESTDSLALNERKEIEDEVPEALDKKLLHQHQL